MVIRSHWNQSDDRKHLVERQHKYTSVSRLPVTSDCVSISAADKEEDVEVVADLYKPFLCSHLSVAHSYSSTSHHVVRLKFVCKRG